MNRWIYFLVFMGLLAACEARQPAGTPPAPTLPAPTGMTADETATLSSLIEVDDYPLYVMHYQGAYQLSARPSAPISHNNESLPAWGCSLFAAMGNDATRLYGRNFDWQYSPALLLFTAPPDGYASVSMVDIEYLGFKGDSAKSLADLPLEARAPLLGAPGMPFDGMNEKGLVIGMAAVPSGGAPADPSKPTIGSIGIIREILDHAATVDEAITIFEQHNIDMAGGPPIHYLVSDKEGHSALIEFSEGAMVVLPNESPWHLATNFLCTKAGNNLSGQCWRYDRLAEAFSATDGILTETDAMHLLKEVAQEGTQWSVVYNASTGAVNVAIHQNYNHTQSFELKAHNK